MELSKSQEEAVKTIDGQVILISCPGSGKTSTVVRRVKYMVDQGIPPTSILVLTFSKAAAMEMKERFLKLPGGNMETEKNVWFSTIHSFCYNVLAPAYKLTSQNILLETEGWMIVRRGLEALKKKGTLKMEIRDYGEFTSSCIREISMVNNNGVDWNSYRAETCPTKEFHAIYDLYEEEKRNLGKIDYDDMLRMCLELLSNRPEYLEFYRNRFRYLIIDEYQDTNFLQRDILYLLAGGSEKANICVVGDDDQSIYKFRGAKPEIMLNFAESYPSCKQIYMDVNYRSRPFIVNCAKRLIEHNTVRFEKDIKPFKDGTGIVETSFAKNSSLEVANLVKKLESVHQNGIPYEDMAVLYRNNKQAGFLSLMLLGNNIPFHSNDAVQSPYKHWIFSDIMAFYRMAEGIGTKQDFIQILNKPNRFLPPQIFRDIDPHDEKAAIRAVSNSGLEYWKIQRGRTELHDFYLNLKMMKGTDPVRLLDLIDGMAGYRAYLKSYAQYRNMDETELTEVIKSYLLDIKEPQISSMDGWIEYAKQVNAKIDRINSEKGKKTGITISTMHKSKGLEWDVVFLFGANEGTIPSSKAKNREAVEEERRLFYVAATRAKEQLYISYVKDENGNGTKSRFITEFMGDIRDRKDSAVSNKSPARFRKGQKVRHRLYGKGIVVQTVPGAVAVKFDDETVIRKFEQKEYDTLTITA